MRELNRPITSSPEEHVSRIATNPSSSSSLTVNNAIPPSPINLNQNNPLTSGQPRLDAVIIRNLTYEIGRGRAKRPILNKISLTVPEGSIYGLLGPSGCGKTTMLRCVVGRLKARRSGSVLVFGLAPGDGRGQVPGRDIGYMPQEISIYEDFTIEETLIYFAKINRMQGAQISSRIDFLLKFLDLPTKSRPVVNLSGGQKRRVSLAAALVHSPPLLILDEPTVGVDPLLRKNIWSHLVTLTQTERISVIITTHYIEEARQADVVGLMRNGRILAENSPDNLMKDYGQVNLEDVFLHLCVTDSARRSATVSSSSSSTTTTTTKDHHHHHRLEMQSSSSRNISHISEDDEQEEDAQGDINNLKATSSDHHEPQDSSTTMQAGGSSKHKQILHPAHIKIHTGTNKIEMASFTNDTLDFTSDDEVEPSGDRIKHNETGDNKLNGKTAPTNAKQLLPAPAMIITQSPPSHQMTLESEIRQRNGRKKVHDREETLDYLTGQALGWSARRNNELNMIQFKLSNRAFVDGTIQLHTNHQRSAKLGLSPMDDRYKGKRDLRSSSRARIDDELNMTSGGGDPMRHQRRDLRQNHWLEWWRTLIAVTWKNYVRLRRNPPVLIFQFMLPAIQVILFCLCIGGEPFDVPVAVVNDETIPRSSIQFLNGLDKRVIRQIRYDNLTSAIEAVKRGHVWGALHIPDKYSQNLQSRLIMGEEVTNETLTNGTIRVYPDLTNLHLALALETTFRETFFNFARNSLEDMGYDKSLADLPIQLGAPVYGTLKKDSYLEFMAPGVVISISYVMATGLTALAFILERRDGLLERSLVSGVGTSQILIAHAINQVVVMIIQIFLVLGCTFFVFEIPSRGPFFWVVLLILLQGCTGMAFGLLVSAVCKEENTAVMMVVGTFYTNLILAGIIWPIEAMPHWLRPVSYAQPQTLATETLRHILSRGWGMSEPAVLLGFAVTFAWLFVFLIAAGLIFKYSR